MFFLLGIVLVLAIYIIPEVEPVAHYFFILHHYTDMTEMRNCPFIAYTKSTKLVCLTLQAHKFCGHQRAAALRVFRS